MALNGIEVEFEVEFEIEVESNIYDSTKCFGC